MSLIIRGKTTVGTNYITDNLVLYLKGSDVISTTWYDSSSSGIDGTLTNGLEYSSAEFGKLIYTGNNEYVNFGNLADTSPLALTSNFTIEQVFKPTDYQPNAYYGITNTLLLKGNLSTVNYLTQLDSSTVVRFTKRGSGESLQGHTFTVPTMTDNINTLSFVISGNTTVICYHNGIYIGEKTITGTAIESQTTEATSISRSNNSSDMTFIGNYYSCRVYSKALSSTEVKRN